MKQTSKIYNQLIEYKTKSKAKFKNLDYYSIHKVTKFLMYITNKNKINKVSHKIVIPKPLRLKVLTIAHTDYWGLGKTK